MVKLNTDKLYFICSKEHEIDGKLVPDTLAIVITPFGVSHIAFADGSLAEKYMELAGLKKICFALSKNDLTEDHLFDFDKNDVIVFQNISEINTFLEDRNNFEYNKYTIKFKHPIQSKHIKPGAS